ncbi:MAG TPA: gluconate 2-dehydrogenase subunit 3 family protein [Myxococcaceae bacterium]|jgi:gluconate 2-dehydrogenase gamma chain
MAPPDDDDLLTRRALIQHLTFLGGGVVLLAGTSCKREEPAKGKKLAQAPGTLTTRHRTFTNAEYDTMSAACERILPRDQDPGALDANVPEYIDRMLQSPELTQQRDLFINGLEALDRRARSANSGLAFWQIPVEAQDELLKSYKESRPQTGEAHFYELLVVLTLEGFLGDPSYGGNKDRVGWALVGFGTSEPPEGYDGAKHLHSHTGHPR